MQYRSLGRTGTRVSELCLGCMMFGGRTDEGSSFDIIDRAIDSGINFLDTANVYRVGCVRNDSGIKPVHTCSANLSTIWVF
jgi:aryl-alcohol dehydrogenase-like predicted oxidoreductase